ncbi:MAG: VOC family protein, partial [Mesorhizobium sp.]
AAKRVTDSGGTILIGPMEVPGGGWIVMCTDPQGAHFALAAPVR